MACQPSGTAKVMPTVGAVTSWYPAGVALGRSLCVALALAEALSSPLLVLSASASFLLSLLSPLSDSAELSEAADLEESEPSVL